MPSITVTDSVASDVRLLAMAWEVTEDQVIGRLLEEFRARVGSQRFDATPERVPVHAVYHGSRVEGEFEPGTGRVVITSGPLAGRSFRSPSGAAIAVVQKLNPAVQPNRNGWGFWTVTETGKVLESMRRR